MLEDYEIYLFYFLLKNNISQPKYWFYFSKILAMSYSSEGGYGAGDMALWVRMPAAFAADLNSVSSMNMVALNHL